MASLPPGESRQRAEEAALAIAPKQPAADATIAQSRFLAVVATKSPVAIPLLKGAERADRLRSKQTSY